VLLVVHGDRLPERLGRPLDPLWIDRQRRQDAEEVAAFGEADQRRRRPHHARTGRGARRALDPQGSIAGTEALGAGGAVVIGPLQPHCPQRRQNGLRLPPRGVGRLPAPTGHGGSRMVRVVGVDPSGHGPGAAPRRRLHRLEVQRIGRPLAYECLDFGEDLRGEGRLEFFLPSVP